MKRIISITVLALSCISSATSQSLTPSRKVSIDQDWKFSFGHASNPKEDFNYGIAVLFSKSGSAVNTAIDPRFDDSHWRSLSLPHDWAVELPFVKSDNADVMAHGYKPVGGLFPETSIGWYRKHFTVVKADSGRRFQLQFDGIFRDASIWLNGFYLGNNKSGYLGVAYDVTDYINFNKDNVLVVRVDAIQYEGWFYEGAGIYRHAWLNTFSNLHVKREEVFTYSKVTGTRADVSVEVPVENQNFTAAEAVVKVWVATRDGKVVASSQAQSVALSAREVKSQRFTLPIANPTLWTVENPYRYQLKIEINQAGKIIDSHKLRIGIRTVEVKPNGVFVNGIHVKLQGVNGHQDHAGVGSALPDYLQYYRIGLLKNMGVNAYRTSHNAPAPELLEACDSLGMLVLDEHRLLNSSPEYANQFERLIKRDRNHPSVFMWSIGNEEGWVHTTSVGKRIALSLIGLQKDLDPTRTCTYAADLPNVFKGINEVIPVRSFNYRHFAVADYHKDHPAQPIIGTEMGSTVTTRGIYEKDSLRGYVPDQDITAPWWASKAEDWWTLAAPNDFWLGGFVWTGFDYRGEPTPYQWPNINSHFGIMDMCGFPKNIYYYYQSWWTDKDVLHISPHWNWQDQRGKPIDVWVNSNADSVTLLLNGKNLGTKRMLIKRHLNWKVNYAPGRLEAIGYKKGKQLHAKVETTGTPAEVVITPYKTTLLADGKDVAIINVTVIDRDGREVPNADNMIHFSITGSAKIIGVGNGDPSSHEPDQYSAGTWQRSLFNGKCQLIVQSGTKPDLIHIEAKAENLWAGATDIVTVSPASVATVSKDHTYDLKGEAAKPREVGKILGADISFLPELEARGISFSDNGNTKDAIQILKDHGFNYVRLRIFNDPSRDDGYAPKKGFCDLQHTKEMAARVKKAGLKLLLDFHYSDYWADPGKQYKPAAWKNLSFAELQKSVYEYTRKVMQELKDQGTAPDMVQIGNEINHGMIWPEGSVAHIDSLAQLIKAGSAGVKSVDPATALLLHVALGGQNHESVFFLDKMVARGVPFDVIGESYYPKWHGTLDDLRDNLTDLIHRYGKDVVVVEYSQLKEEVNTIVFDLPDGKGKGTFIWEPLNTWESVFDQNGKSKPLLLVYDEISKKFITSK